MAWFLNAKDIMYYSKISGHDTEDIMYYSKISEHDTESHNFKLSYFSVVSVNLAISIV